MDALLFRPLNAADVAAWRALGIEGARDFPLGFLVTQQETEALCLDQSRMILDAGGFYGVFVGAALVGFCGYRPQQLTRTRHRGEIGPFYVTPSYQGAGAAQTMMHGVMDAARLAGLARLELYVDAENHRAIAFYERYGFVRTATLHDSVRINGAARTDHFYVLRLDD